MASKNNKNEINPERILNSFTNNVENLLDFVQSIAPIAASFDNNALRKLDKLKVEISEIISQGSKSIHKETIALESSKKGPMVNNEAVERIIDVIKEYKRLPWLKTERTKLLYKSALVMLASYVDYLISDIIRCYHKTFPDSLSDKNLTISLTELKSCADRDEAVDLLLNKKLDSLMYGNLDSQKLYLKNDVKSDLMGNMINWDVINEVIERRNVIVHNDGIINRRYLKNVNISTILEDRKSIIEGAKLQVTDKYFNAVSIEVLFAGIVLLQSCWRKWFKKDADKADTNLTNIMLELTAKKEYSILERLGIFSKQIQTYDAENRYILDFIYYLSLKRQGKTSELDLYLSKIDKSALRPKFLAALSALSGDRTGFYENVKKAASIGDLVKSSFDDSSLMFLLNEFEKDEDFKQKIEQIFKDKQPHLN
jgi:hypothetical protein